MWMQAKTGREIQETTIEFAMFLDVVIADAVVVVVVFVSNNG